MRIISKFRDYYDGVQAYGLDKDLCYVRERKDKLVTPAPYDEKFKDILDDCPNLLTYAGDNESTAFIVGFCGKFYQGMRQNVSLYTNMGTQVYDVSYDVNHVERYITAIKNRAERKEKMAYLSHHRWAWRIGKQVTRKEEFELYFNQVIPDDDQIFFDLNVPVFVVHAKSQYRRTDKSSTEIIINPCLKDYGFVQQYDPFTTFQEIDMFLGGVLGINEPDMVSISDEHMRDKKGFNDMSFKKYPTKRR